MSRAQDSDSDDAMDEFMEKFRKEKYKGAFNVDNWEEEFEKVPMFMKTAPKEIDPKEHPDLACLQSIIHDDDRPPEEQAKALKDEGNEYFKEKNYKKAIVSYSEALKKKCTDTDLCAVLYTNRAAAHFHLGNMRSALNDSLAAKKLKPDHVKALIRGAQCCVKLGNFSEALQWCDEGLGVHAKDVTLQELRATADKLKRTAERDARKSKVKEKKERVEREALLGAIRERGIKLLKPDKPSKHCSDSEEEDVGSTRALAELDLNDLCSQEATGFKVHLDEQGVLHWPVLFLYPEHGQTDFISSFNENDRFIDHLTVMFGEELPPWDTEKKYQPRNLELYFDDERGQLLQLENEMSLLRVLQNDRCLVKEGTPSFIVLVRDSAFCKSFLSGKKVHRLK
ncbi:tetratricopeptide repeat protein 4 [Paramormyrops kingsleyae]|uniref:Tetratricopeptide repeat domain 4 n=1 Tax=Paramormyrops kingsleyae TaxID=1676925 RepID=A0A3B3R6X9_9TELE|nr:tetratricopeptide repeat protein 4 [Paramormyrops kingsleyae]